MHECACNCGHKWSLEVWRATYLATYMAAGRIFARQLQNQDVDRFAKIKWKATEGESGVIDLDLIPANDLWELMGHAGF